MKSSDKTQLDIDLTELIKGSASADQLEAYTFAKGLLPAYGLLRSLFYQGELEASIRLMVLYELIRTPGRYSLERIRRCAAYFPAALVDSHVRSLREGGWLDLRASDNTYALSSRGLNLLSLLHAANLENLSATNAISRAAQNAQFGASLDGTDDHALSFLLDNLVLLLENQIDSALQVLSKGRPAALVTWSRAEHTKQLAILRTILDELQSRLDEASNEFDRFVNLHEAMQKVVLHHTSINRRLREWNIENLHTSDGGYAVSELAEAVLGVDDIATLEKLIDDDIISLPHRTVSLTTSEACSRFSAAKRKLTKELLSFSYAAPSIPDYFDWDTVDMDDTEALLHHLRDTLLLRSVDSPPLELNEWLTSNDFSVAAYEVALLCRIQYQSDCIPVSDTVVGKIECDGHSDCGFDFVSIGENLFTPVRIRLMNVAERE